MTRRELDNPDERDNQRATRFNSVGLAVNQLVIRTWTAAERDALREWAEEVEALWQSGAEQPS